MDMSGCICKSTTSSYFLMDLDPTQIPKADPDPGVKGKGDFFTFQMIQKTFKNFLIFKNCFESSKKTNKKYFFPLPLGFRRLKKRPIFSFF